MRKYTTVILALGFIALTACTTVSSSLPSESSSTTTSSSSSSEIPSSSTSVSSSEIVEDNYKEIEISRSTWPLLTFSPFVPTRAFFNNVQFKYMGANNGTANVIMADSASFFIYNVNPLLNVERIVLNKALIKNSINFKVYGSNMPIDNESNATINEQIHTRISPVMISPLVYAYDFSQYEFSYFRITNGAFPLTLQSIQIFISESFEFPTDIGSGTGEPLPDTGDGYYQLTEPTIARDDFKFMAGSALDGAALPHVGNPKVLVVPVLFTDYACGFQFNCETVVNQIDKAFFGTSEDTPYESVRSYYYKSSYGNLTIDGTVTPIYEVGKTTVEWAREKRTGRQYDQFYHPAWGLTEDVTAWYKTLTNSNLSEYDGNGDGWIDAIYLLYLAPAYPRFYPSTRIYPEDVERTFWAYVYWNYNNVSLANEADPIPFTFSFLGYDFMYEGYGQNQIDAITYIHETGHILGLTDYYSYDTDISAWGPTGRLDMMDNNVLDHNAYSKFLLEWINPYVIDNTKQETTITIAPFESSGDAIIVKNGFNGSPYDNYLILEYYTPTGLNEEHSQAPYAGNNLRGFTEPGVKIYHVDSRLGAYDWNSGNFKGFTNEVIIPENENYTEYYMIVNSNSVTRHRGDMTYMKLIHLLESSGNNTFRLGGSASNDTLFQTGDYFNPLKHFAAMTIFGQFNDGTEIGYEITIGEMTPEGVTITFTRWSF
jgi:M6 family metalloprotease-like protein